MTIAREPRPGIAAVLSLVIPGAGQMYMGRPVAGIVWLLATLVGYALLIVPGLLLHICCIVNAATVSRATTALAALPPSPSGFWLCPSCGKRARGPRFCQQCGASMAGATPALP